MPPQVHLEEAILRCDVALPAEQVGGRVGVNVRDPLLVAQHIDPAIEGGHSHFALGLREGAAGEPHAQHGSRDSHDDQNSQRRQENASKQWGHDPRVCHTADLRADIQSPACLPTPTPAGIVSTVSTSSRRSPITR